jgi:hypothetical protein
MADGARAGVVLGTDYSSGTPLSMTAGTTSGPMLVDVVSDNAPNDVMGAWNFQLVIVAGAGATGTLVFQDPANSTTPVPPANYIFGTDGFGMSVVNTGSSLTADDFYYNLASSTPGVVVPGSPGANLLQMDFLASSGASGSFGIYAMEGAGITQWTDSGFKTQYFTNVPAGTGLVEIGAVMVSPQSVPEPSSLGLLGLAVATLAGCQCWSNRKRAPG